MPDPVVRLDPARLPVEPGGQVRTVLTVANTGPLVEGYTVTVLGAAAAWAHVLTPEISVYPQQETSVVVVFAPPAGAAVAGEVPYGLRVASLVDGAAAAVVEGDLEIGRVFGLQATLTPVNSTGRWSARHRVAFTNWGNAPVRLRLMPSDADERLGFLVSPEVVDVTLGGTAVARLRVRTRAPTLRGAPARLPFRVVGEPDPPSPRPAVPGAPDPRRPVLDGTFNQKPVLSKAVVIAAVLGVAAAVALAGYALSRPGGSGGAGLGTGAPAPPTVTATPVDAANVQLVWKPVAGADGYTAVVSSQSNDFKRIDFDSALTAGIVPGLAPSTEYCFVMTAVRGKQPSAPSMQVCAKTPAPPVPTQPPSGGTISSPGGATSMPPTAGGSAGTRPPDVPADQPIFGPADWVAVVYVHDVNDPLSAMAEEERASLKPPTPAKAYVLKAMYYPGLGFSPSTLAVSVGPFAAKDLALAYCRTLPTGCADQRPPGALTSPTRPSPTPSPGSS